jgi:glycosyltransferase involved in cell wall biosynthesis
MLMKIFVDARWVRTDYHDGISRYTAGVVSGFKANKIPITLLIHDERQLKLLPSDLPYEKVNYPISPKELFLGRKLNQLGADIVYSPLQIMGSFGRRYKLILTLQDIIYYRHPQPPTNLPLYVRIAWRLFHMAHWPQRLILNAADYIGTVSHYSKKYISQMHLTDREIVVVYNASSLDLSKAKRHGKPTKNIVYMGSFMPYKNVEVLIKGMAYLPKTYTLHLLSKISPERKSELESMVEPGVEVVFHNGASDDEYIELITNADCVATGSKEEGFGLPIVESQSVGTPVVISDMEIFHEVAGDGALFFDSDSPQDFAHQVSKLADPKTRSQLIEKGHKQAEQFAWSKSAAELYEVMKKLHASKGV